MRLVGYCLVSICLFFSIKFGGGERAIARRGTCSNYLSLSAAMYLTAEFAAMARFVSLTLVSFFSFSKNSLAFCLLFSPDGGC